MSCLYALTGLTCIISNSHTVMVYHIKYLAVTNKMPFVAGAVMVYSFADDYTVLKVPELVCVLWLLVLSPSRVTVNLAFSGSSGHGLPQLPLLEPSNSSVYSDTDRDRAGLCETHNPKMPSHSLP